jgi:FHA domain
VQLQLQWTDPQTGTQFKPVLEPPIGLGSEFAAMPNLTEAGQRVSRIVLAEAAVDPYHALITEREGELLITDRGSRLGTQVNGVRLPSSTLFDGDRLQIGSFEIQVTLIGAIRRPDTGSDAESANPLGGCDRMIGFLVKRRCGRTDRTGCPNCNGGQSSADPNYDPYFYERNYYPGFGFYRLGDWGHPYYSDRNSYSYNSETRSVDFTEADGTSLEQENEGDYEQDMGAS